MASDASVSRGGLVLVLVGVACYESGVNLSLNDRHNRGRRVVESSKGGQSDRVCTAGGR